MSKAALLLAALLGALVVTTVRADDPLYLQPAFDEITLDENNSGAVLRVQPLNLPGHKLPPEAARQGDLEVELVDRPGEKFALPWVNVVGARFFEQLVLAEADQRVKAGQFDEAHPYFIFLEAKHPQTAGLKESIEYFLWVQIGGAYRVGRNDEALALLVELYGRNPRRQGLSTAYEKVTTALVKDRLAAQNYRAARGLLNRLAERFPDLKASAVDPVQAQLQAQGQSLLTAAQAALAAGQPREAHEAIRQTLAVWPAIAGGKELAQSIHEKYPVVAVGVIAPLSGPPRSRLDDWAAARTAPLVGRPLVERVAPGAEGGLYHSPFGELIRGEDSRQLTLRLQPGITWSDPPRALTGHDVARCLLARADPRHAAYDRQWADVLGGVEVRGSSDVRIELSRPLAAAEAWLQMPLWTELSAGGISTYGPYRLDVQAAGTVRLVRQPAYFAAISGQPSEIVERTYPDSAAALRALRGGEVSVVDRISPWDLPRAGTGEITVRPYAAPTVHVLVPHPGKPLVANRTLRRALLYGLDRQTILRRGLLAGQELAGCEVLSGPFPRGPASEPFAAAHNPQVEPRPYEPGTAIVLVRAAMNEVAAETAATKGPPALVLAHPASPVARVACQSIARQWQLVGVQVSLRELTAEGPMGDYDLRYAELTIREPAVDAWRVLGPHGIAGACSSAMLAALRAADAATNQQEAAARLQAVYRLAAVELPVIPLWQMTEHFAFHNSLKGVSERPISLYDGASQWQAELRIPAE